MPDNIPQAEIEAIQAILQDPKLFAETFCVQPTGDEEGEPFVCNYPQRVILSQKNANVFWIAVHRRGGKTYGITFKVCFDAISNKNKTIIVFAPAKKQLDEFFFHVDAWISHNPIFAEELVGTKNSPDPERTFRNGTRILGLITGVSSNTQEGKRGFTADYIFVDEAQGMKTDDWRVIMAMIQGDQRRVLDKKTGQMVVKGRAGKVKAYITGTIKDPGELFYEKVSGVASLGPKERVIKIPIDKNPDFTPEDLERMRLEVANEDVWRTEYLLLAGDLSTNVFRVSDLDLAKDHNIWDYSEIYDQPYKWNPENRGLHVSYESPCFIGVDWDKYGTTGTNIAVVKYDVETKDFYLVFRQEVPPSKDTYLEACDAIVKLVRRFHPLAIVTDHGANGGNTEILIERLFKAGIGEYAERVKSLAFQSNITFFSAEKGEEDEMMAKPFLVKQLKRKFEDMKVHFPETDTQFYSQLLDYKIKRITTRGPSFSTQNEHVIDCVLFCLYGMWLNFESHDPVYSPSDFISTFSAEQREETQYIQEYSSRVAAWLHDEDQGNSFTINSSDPFSRSDISFGSIGGHSEDLSRSFY